MTRPNTPTLDRVAGPSDLKSLNDYELAVLAEELRAETISAVSETGGHLGSSLGVVELTVAIHAVFDAPRDKLVWDVGHQCYPHKILTGRRDRIRTLRQKDGLSGFTKRAESEYDPFGAAHSSTSISAALGFATGRDLGQSTGDAIAVIGDGSISAGMAYEALNNAGSEGRRLFVILNDNEMSIAPPVGAMSTYLSNLSTVGPLPALRSAAEGIEAAMPRAMRDGARRARDMVMGIDNKGTFFEELGFDYVGPVDGHNMTELLHVLRAARARATGPVLIHCSTVKGKGYQYAEGADDKYHGVARFDNQVVPPHVRHLHRGVAGLDPDHLAANPAKARHVPILAAPLGHHLHPDADPEERAPSLLHGLDNGFIHAVALEQGSPAGREGPVAG